MGHGVRDGSEEQRVQWEMRESCLGQHLEAALTRGRWTEGQPLLEAAARQCPPQRADER